MSLGGANSRNDPMEDDQQNEPHPYPCFSRTDPAVRDAPTLTERMNRARTQAFRNLGHIFRDGLGNVAKNIADAEKCFQHAAIRGDLASKVYLAELYLAPNRPSDDIDRAVEMLRDACDREFIPAYAVFAQCLRHGHGVQRDVSRALKLLQRAAEAKDERAIIELGDCYRAGDGVPLSMTEATQLYRSVAQTSMVALVRVADCTLLSRIDDQCKVALKLYKYAAEQGHKSAYFELAICHARGLGTPRNLNEAFALFRRAADEGEDVEAMRVVAESYSTGTGVEHNLEQASRYLRRAVELGDLESIVALGRRYIKGEGVRKDDNEAIQLFRSATNKGHPGGQLALADCLFEGTGTERDPQAALVLLEKPVMAGFMPAILSIARRYHFGHGVSQSYSDAVTYYSKAVEQGSTDANVALAELNMRGLGVPTSPERAFQHWSRAASNGHVIAKTFMGRCLRLGIGVERDMERAFWLVKDAAKAGFAPAKRDLAMCHIVGAGTPPDSNRGVELLRELTRANDAVAMRYLGELYWKGIHFPRDIAKAADVFHKASALGDVVATTWFGYCLRDGLGVKADAAAAATRFEWAMQRGSMDATAFLAQCFEGGVGVSMDMKRAVSMYEQVVKCGIVEYEPILQRCYTRLFDEEVAQREMQLLEVRRKKGDVHATARLAWLLFKGLGGKADVPQAIELMHAAYATGESAVAICFLASCYEKGRGVSQNEVRAIELLQEGHGRRMQEASVKLARFIMEGRGVQPSIENGLRLLTEQADRGSYAACVQLGGAYRRGYIKIRGKRLVHSQNLALAATYYAKAVDSGYALLCLARMYLRGEGVARDAQRGEELLWQASGRDCAKAQLAVCRLLERRDERQSLQIRLQLYKASVHRVCGRGRGRAYFRYARFLRLFGEQVGELTSDVQRDRRVMQYLTMAREEKYELAANDLAVMLVEQSAGRDGRGEEDEEGGPSKEAFTMFWELGCGQNHKRALLNCGICFEHGLGVKPDARRAKEYYSKAIDGVTMGVSDGVAECNLGVLLVEEGKVDEGVALIKRSAQRQEPVGIGALGRLHERGDGVPKDGGEAFRLFQRSADGGCVEALFNLASCYECEIGVEHNEQKAAELFREAKARGYAGAASRLERYE